MTEKFFEIMGDIPAYKTWKKIVFVDKGWSEERKFYIEDKNNNKLLTRISDVKNYELKRREYKMLKDLQSTGVSISQPLDFGKCGKGNYVYTILKWLEGEALDDILCDLTPDKQYKLGLEAGNILKSFHSFEAPKEQENWEVRMKRKIRFRMNKYLECGIKVKNDIYALNYVKNNLHLLENRPQTFHHGDFHIGNLILMKKYSLGVIDFNRWDYGDPYEDFHKMEFFSREKSVHFASGQLNGYFSGNIPDKFYQLQAFYLADVILYSVVWAMPFGNEQVNRMIKRAEMVLDDYDNFKITIPKWLISNK